MSHVYRWHSQLTANKNGPLVDQSPLHLQQSNIDGACGLHCALMALMMFGLVERHELQHLSKTKKKALASVWKQSSPYYFKGTHPKQLKSVFKPYNEQLTCIVVRKNAAPDVSSTLHAGGVCIVGIRNSQFSHWVLAVGTGGKEGFRDAEKLLVLDPSHPALPMLPWNATLAVSTSRRGLHRYETATGTCQVYVDDALLLFLNDETEELDVDLELD